MRKPSAMQVVLPLEKARFKKKPEPRGSGSRELHNLSSYKKIIASHAPEINVTKIVVIPSAWFWREESAVFPWAEMQIPRCARDDNPFSSRETPFNAPFPHVMQITTIRDSLR